MSRNGGRRYAFPPYDNTGRVDDLRRAEKSEGRLPPCYGCSVTIKRIAQRPDGAVAGLKTISPKPVRILPAVEHHV